MLVLVGLGLGDHRDITVRGLELVRSCDRIYLEHYTSILGVDAAKLVRAPRSTCMPFPQRAHPGRRPSSTARMWFLQTVTWSRARQTRSWTLLSTARWPSSWSATPSGARSRRLRLNRTRRRLFTAQHSATTHSDLAIRAKERGIEVKVVHNASIMNAVGCTGLQLYRFGHTVSIPFFTETWKPDSFYDKIQHNDSDGLHTLCLLGEPRPPPARFGRARPYPRLQTSRSRSRTTTRLSVARACATCPQGS